MFLARSLISAAGTASRRSRAYLNYPTNRPSRTPLSSVLRCALSTTPDGDTSGSHSTKNMTIKVGDSPINISPEISSIQSSHSADSNSNVSAKSSDTQSESLKPMDRDVEIRSIKETIKNKDADVVSLSKKIDSLFDEQLAIRRKPEASSRDIALLDSIEKVIADMREDKKRLVAEIAKHEAELSELKNPKELVNAPVPAQGM